MSRVLSVFLAITFQAIPAAAQYEDLAAELDRLGNNASEASKSYRVVFDAFLDLTKPPMLVGPDFNATTIHHRMKSWDAVKAWAAANENMRRALLQVKTREILGLPYSTATLEPKYRNAGISVDLAAGGNLRGIKYGWLNALDVILTYAVAEMYRLHEAGESQAAWELAAATMWFIRQSCDRELAAEKRHCMQALINHLSAMRGLMYAFRDTADSASLIRLAQNEIPFLWPNDRRLAMPEGDQLVVRRLLKDTFNSRGQPDPQKFVEVFAVRQAEREPHTLFGAAKRWAHIAEIHGSLEASQQRLTAIYDDWWRRWRLRPGDPFFETRPEYSRTNPIRYAAVLASVDDIIPLYDLRPLLVNNINGTALAAGLLALQNRTGSYPPSVDNTFGQTTRRRSNSDWFAADFGPFEYRSLSSPNPTDTPWGRVQIEGCILYSKGRDGKDDRGNRHTPDGLRGDLVIWPPPLGVAREAGLTP